MEYATPMNTLGMGNPGPETDPCIPVCKRKKKKLLEKLRKNKIKSLKLKHTIEKFLLKIVAY